MFRHITMGVISGAGDADIPNLYVACSFCSIFLLQSPLTRIICNRFILLDLFCYSLDNYKIVIYRFYNPHN